jgi:hypothetical protein
MKGSSLTFGHFNLTLLELQNIQEASYDTLTYWASNYRPEKITSAIESLHQEIEKGTKFKRSQAAYVRACLDGAHHPHRHCSLQQQELRHQIRQNSPLDNPQNP